MINKYYIRRINPPNTGSYQFAIATPNPNWGGYTEIELDDSFFLENKIRGIDLYDSLGHASLTTGTGSPVRTFDVRGKLYYVPEGHMTDIYVSAFLLGINI